MEHLIILGFVFLNLFMIVGAVDLFYFHMWKYKLHTRPESIYEHKLHGVFALIMVPLGFFLYYQNSGGYSLWAGVFFVAAALGVEMLDVFSEGDSRASVGGLTTGEYSLHVAATIFKVASFAFIFAAKPASAWSLDSELSLGNYGSMGARDTYRGRDARPCRTSRASLCDGASETHCRARARPRVAGSASASSRCRPPLLP